MCLNVPTSGVGSKVDNAIQQIGTPGGVGLPYETDGDARLAYGVPGKAPICSYTCM